MTEKNDFWNVFEGMESKQIGFNQAYLVMTYATLPRESLENNLQCNILSKNDDDHLK
jgi:hypothetical protein